MEMLIVIAAAILAWVAGAIWYRLTDRIYGESSALQVRNTGHPLSRSVTPYLLAGVALVAVAAMMRVSKMTVYRMVHAGEMPAVRVGRSFRVPEQAVHDYLRDAFIEAG